MWFAGIEATKTIESYISIGVDSPRNIIIFNKAVKIKRPHSERFCEKKETSCEREKAK